MNTSWKDISTAPKGVYVEQKTGKGIVKRFIPEWCFVAHRGKRYWTYMLENGRWNGFTKDEKPELWHPAPELPTKDKNQ